MVIQDTKPRLLAKAVIYRIISVITTFFIAWFISNSLAVSATTALVISLSDHSLKFIILYYYEKIWNTIRFGRKMKKTTGCCIWLTGLSASGKTTIALKLVEALEVRLCKVDYLDGDIVRKTFCRDLGFSKEDRDENLRRVSYVAAHLSSHSIVISAFISPYAEARSEVKQICSNFIEVYVNAPLAVCEARDPKGLYKKARAGELKQFTGIDDPYEAPSNPDLELRTDQLTVDQCVDKIIQYLLQRKLIS